MRRRLSMLMLAACLGIPALSLGQSYPVYWDARQDSYKWGGNLVDLATETWVLAQGYLSAAQVTNVAETVAASVTNATLLVFSSTDLVGNVVLDPAVFTWDGTTLGLDASVGGENSRQSLWFISATGRLSMKSEPVDYADHWEVNPATWGSMRMTTNVTSSVWWEVSPTGRLQTRY